MNTLIIFNATAKRARFLKNRIKNQLRLLDINGHFVEVHKKGEATKITTSALQKGVTTVIAIGGDGLVNNLIQVLANTDTTLAVIPTGKTNLLAHMLGIHDWKTGCLALKNGEHTAIDLGQVEDLYFTSSIEIHPKEEKKKTMIARVRKKSTPRYYPATIEVSSEQNEFVAQTDVASISVSPYPFAKGTPAPDFLSDQLLHVLVKSRPTGSHQRPVQTLLQGNRIAIDTKVGVPVLADGEPIGKTPVTLSVAPESLKVIRAKA